MGRSVEAATNIRPFRVEFPADAVEDLRRRIAAARWPSKELVADRSQGVQLEALQALVRYWLNEYDFGRVEARLNALPQFVTEIDGVDVHFIHIRSPHDDALPLIMTHGWPGSVIEMLDAVGPLTDPTAHGGSAEDGFHLVLPSLPGYGFSSEPVEIGWDLGRTARAWAELMRRLGYTRFVAQGGDVGAGVTDAMGRQEPAGLIGIHTNLLVPALSGPMPTDTDEERAAAGQPVQRDVVEDVVAREVARGPPVGERAGDLVVRVRVVVDHPGGEGDRLRPAGLADRLRPGGHLDEVAVSRLPEGRELRGSGAFFVGVRRHRPAQRRHPAGWCGCRSGPRVPDVPSRR